jgi:UDP-glucuronate 4-epimerase
VRLIERILGKSAIRELLPMQPGDVPETYADVSALCKAVRFRPDTSIVDGIASFVEWFRGFAHK